MTTLQLVSGKTNQSRVIDENFAALNDGKADKVAETLLLRADDNVVIEFVVVNDGGEYVFKQSGKQITGL